MIKRLREAYSAEELASIYATPHQHKEWKDHIHRVEMTIAFAKWFGEVTSIADLSCGDGAIINALSAQEKYLGDFAPGYDFHGAIEQTIREIPSVDLFICSETLEHLDDPLAVLKEIRKKTRYLALSTPYGEIDKGNPQHYWGWDKEGISSLLHQAGFKPVIYTLLEFFDPSLTYNYQLWGCQ